MIDIAVAVDFHLIGIENVAWSKPKSGVLYNALLPGFQTGKAETVFLIGHVNTMAVDLEGGGMKVSLVGTALPSISAAGV